MKKLFTRYEIDERMQHAIMLQVSAELLAKLYKISDDRKQKTENLVHEILKTYVDETI